MAVAEGSPSRLRVARVVQLTGQVIGRHLGLFLLLAFLINAPIVLLTFLFVQGAEVDAFSIARLVGFVLGLFIFILGYVVLQAAIIHITVLDLNGRRPPLGESLKVGLREFLPLIAISILYTLGIALGIVLLIVPGIMALCAWAVVMPVRVVEHTGIGEAFGRSRELTRGHRWNIFFLFLIYIGIEIVIGVVIGAFTAVFGEPLEAGEAVSLAGAVSLVGQIISNTLNSVILTAGLAALYYELRVTKEGIGPEALASVFD
jgi:hypothetical protein